MDGEGTPFAALIMLGPVLSLKYCVTAPRGSSIELKPAGNDFSMQAPFICVQREDPEPLWQQNVQRLPSRGRSKLLPSAWD